MKKKLHFRAWYYFRTGYTQYFSFILAVANMFTITYYLAIENSNLNFIFPSFSSYVLISSIIIIPSLTIIGLLHIKRSAAFSSEVEITAESHPYNYKLRPGIQKECMAPLFLELLRLGRKSLSDEKLTEEELQKLQVLQQKLDIIAKGGNLLIHKRLDDF